MNLAPHSSPMRTVLGSRRVVCLVACSLVFGEPVLAEWPTYRHDSARSGYASEPVPSPLSLAWSVPLPHAPQPAWPRSSRMTYDRAYQPILAANLVCFGSSVNGRIYALNAQDGTERWSFGTDAPVRFAPVFCQGRFFATSDDGHLYCLEADTGRLLWKRRGGPDHSLVLGNQQMISRWPARGGAAASGGAVYFAAGIWPSDGVYLYALDAEDGHVLWVNDTAGYNYMGQPHGGANAHSGIAPQGYLATGAGRVFVPNGRAVPAAFGEANGAFQYFHLQRNGQHGGSALMVADAFFINDGIVFDQKTGEAVDKAGPGPVVALPGGLLGVRTNHLVTYRWADLERVNRKGEKEAFRGLQEIGRAEHGLAGAPSEMIVAGTHAFLGASGEVRRVDLERGVEVWKTELNGIAQGLAVSDGRLYVSTDRGILYCYGERADAPKEYRSPAPAEPYGSNPAAQQAAREILEKTGLSVGYCLDMGCGDGALAYELARRTQLHIVAVDGDPEMVALARSKLAAAGLLGARVTVLHRDLADTGLPIYFANLIVSGRSVAQEESVVFRAEVSRLQRPYGGVLALGRPGAVRCEIRGPLEGAGQWTHQYADPANTLCSNDELVQGPLGMLWFADIDQRLVQRHGRAPAPLFNNGILYSEGMDGLVAVDAYNGTLLWDYPLPGILAAYHGDHLMGSSGTGSNFCLSEDAVYVRHKDQCLRLDARTGKRLATFAAPRTVKGAPAPWGFLAQENGLLFGSLANPEHVVTYRYLKGGDLGQQLTESTTLFALDAVTGELKWRYDAKHSLRHNAIAVGAGYVVLIDRPLALFDRVRDAAPTNHDGGELVTLYAGSGEVLWKNDQDIYGTVTALSVDHHCLLMSYQPTRFRLASELGGRLACFNLANGERRWDRTAAYNSRPILNDRTIYAEGGAWDLLTGEERPFPFKRSYGCGILAGARKLLVYRSATLGYFDLNAAYGTEDFGGMRPGCWINALPAGGLVFVPDATAGCVCSYQNQAWIALQPDGIRPPLVEPDGEMFPGPVLVRLTADRPESERIHYTLDGAVPGLNSPRYDRPFTLAQTAVVCARSFGSNNRASRVVTARFTIDASKESGR